MKAKAQQGKGEEEGARPGDTGVDASEDQDGAHGGIPDDGQQSGGSQPGADEQAWEHSEQGEVEVQPKGDGEGEMGDGGHQFHQQRLQQQQQQVVETTLPTPQVPVSLAAWAGSATGDLFIASGGDSVPPEDNVDDAADASKGGQAVEEPHARGQVGCHDDFDGAEAGDSGEAERSHQDDSEFWPSGEVPAAGESPVSSAREANLSNTDTHAESNSAPGPPSNRTPDVARDSHRATGVGAAANDASADSPPATAVPDTPPSLPLPPSPWLAAVACAPVSPRAMPPPIRLLATAQVQGLCSLAMTFLFIVFPRVDSLFVWQGGQEGWGE